MRTPDRYTTLDPRTAATVRLVAVFAVLLFVGVPLVGALLLAR